MNNVVTIPRELAERGDLVMIPKVDYRAFRQWQKSVKIDPEDAWFWTPEWQKKEREADEDIKNGRVHGPFKTSREFFVALNDSKKKK